MFGWRRRNEGFEWREYVRTTILLRRNKRREQLDEIRDAAVKGVKHAGQQGSMAGKAGLQAAGRGSKAALGAAARLPGAIGTWLGAFLRPAFGKLLALLRPAIAHLQDSRCRTPIGVIAAVAVIAAVIRYPIHGFDRDGRLAVIVAVLAAAVLMLPGLFAGSGTRASALYGRVREELSRMPGLDRLGAGRLRGAAALLAIALTGAGGWYLVAPRLDVGSLAGFQLAPSTRSIEGRATAASGDTLRIRQALIRLKGIEAPDPSQQCVLGDGKRWRCGQAAAQALASALRNKQVTCEVPDDRQSNAPAIGTCRAGSTDIAADLVRGGHVFADTGLFATYAGLEQEARAKKAGLWRGDADRPADYRAKIWDEARRSAPTGCPIKGRITSGERIYVLPWSSDYHRVRIRDSRGERWFCSEDEAKAAGWRRNERS